MGTLELRVGEDAVYVHYLPADAGPNIGGNIGLVYKGGTFHGVGFDELRAWALVAIRSC